MDSISRVCESQSSVGASHPAPWHCAAVTQPAKDILFFPGKVLLGLQVQDLRAGHSESSHRPHICLMSWFEGITRHWVCSFEAAKSGCAADSSRFQRKPVPFTATTLAGDTQSEGRRLLGMTNQFCNQSWTGIRILLAVSLCIHHHDQFVRRSALQQ